MKGMRKKKLDLKLYKDMFKAIKKVICGYCGSKFLFNTQLSGKFLLGKIINLILTKFYVLALNKKVTQ
jgi:hypothetical protein